ncbi:MAG: extracellular solute-binding protein [Myxococcales bacterium]|nr:extracellular solute-binding protein [Myxococcales bacterium]
MTRATRRQFLVLAAGGTAALGGCGKRTRAGGSATSAAEIGALMPTFRRLQLLEPDIPGEDPVPAGYLTYPRRVVRVITRRPGTSGRTAKTMTPVWGPIPPGLGHNSYFDAVNADLGLPLDPSLQDGSDYQDKLSAALAARDVPDLLTVPTWVIDAIPRFGQAVKALFADLTEHLRGDAALSYPMLASLPTAAWQYSVWGGRLAAVPFPTTGPFPWALFYRKDRANLAGVASPTTIDELYHFGRELTDPARGVWAFGNVFNMVQMFFKCPGCKTGWRRRVGDGLEFKYETPEYREAVRFTARLYKDGLVHPDLVANREADSKQLFNSGKLIAFEDGLGAWRGMQSEQAKVTPGYDMQPIPLFSAIGGEPLAWGSAAPILYTFVRKGLGRDRTQELLGVLDWCGAPFGSYENELATYGVEGRHFTRDAEGTPIPTDLGRRELGGNSPFTLLGGRVPVEFGGSDVPHYVRDLLAYTRTTVRYLERDLFQGIKVELPASFSKALVQAEDQVSDLLRGRRPVSDLESIVRAWRLGGGDECRSFLERTLSSNAR